MFSTSKLLLNGNATNAPPRVCYLIAGGGGGSSNISGAAGGEVRCGAFQTSFGVVYNIVVGGAGSSSRLITPTAAIGTIIACGGSYYSGQYNRLGSGGGPGSTTTSYFITCGYWNTYSYYVLGGGGGGKDDLAQGGGVDTAKISEAISQISESLRSLP